MRCLLMCLDVIDENIIREREMLEEILVEKTA